MSGNPAAVSEELAATFAEIERYGQALQPASGTLVLRKSPGRATDAVMPRPAVATATPPPRAWSLAAAVEPVPARPVPAPRPGGSEDARHSIAFTDPRRRSRLAIASAALLAALATAAAAALVLRVFERPVASAPPHANAAVALTGLRAVSATAASLAAAAPTTYAFPPGTASVFLDVRYRGQPVGPLTLRLVSRTAPTGSAVTVFQRNFVLAQSGEVEIALEAPSGRFAPGQYVVMAQWRGALLGTTSFAIA
jgi:hypothetical protein